MDTGVIIEIIVLGILDLLILCGNALVMLAFALGPRRLRTFTNYFIVNLAVADLLVGVLPLPFWIYVRTGSTTVASTTHLIFLGFDVTFGCASIFNLTLISIERMGAVRFPTRHFNMSWRPVLAAIFLTWVVSAFIAGLSVFFGLSRIYTYCLCVIVFIVPTVVILSCYSVIFKVAKRSASANNTKMRRELKTSKMISIIIGLFLLCWLPFFIVNVVYTHCNGWCDSIPNEILLAAKFLHYSNSMMNVCVYAACSPVFRKAFKAILERKFHRKVGRGGFAFRSTVRRNLTTMELCSDEDTSQNTKRFSKSDPFFSNTSI